MKLLPLLLCACLVGCAAGTKLPQPDPTSAIISTRQQFGPLSNVQWLTISIFKAGDDFRFASGLENGNTDLKLKAGPTVLRLRANFHAWPSAPQASGIQEVYITLPIKLEAARVYRLTGEPRGNRFFVWVEDGATGDRLGTEVSEPYANERRNFHYVPIPSRR